MRRSSARWPRQQLVASATGVIETKRVSEPELPAQLDEPASARPLEDVNQSRFGMRFGWFSLVALFMALIVLCGPGITHVSAEFGFDSVSAAQRINSIDTDGDGLPDKIEKAGWSTRDATVYYTDPDVADTDGDGLFDGDEAGPLVISTKSGNVYAGYSSPTVLDSDDDGLNDGDEADLDLDPIDPDSDDDQMTDGREVQVIGTLPELADTDGDGFDDGYEEANRDSQGLDPLWADIKVSKLTYATDFAKGALAGDLWRVDSLAWLAGNLTSGAASSIPLVGTVIGGLADVRDAVGSAIHADWVGAGFNMVGVLPLGDAAAIPGKVAKFIARNPHLAAKAATGIVRLGSVPKKVKVEVVSRVFSEGWTHLRDLGVGEEALLRLQKRPISLDDLANSLGRSTHIKGESAEFFADGYKGEAWLEGLYGANMRGVDKQVRMSTAACSVGCNEYVRVFDVFVDGVAHESKVGYVNFSESIANQIRSDAYLIKNGDIKGAHWHFLPSGQSDSLGAAPMILDLLEQNGIPYTIHLPE